MKTVISRITPLVLALAILNPPGSAVAQAVQGAAGRPGDVAADRLMDIGTPHARALADALRRGAWDTRRVEGQGRFAAPSAAPHLLVALEDERPIVRRLALWGLSELRAREMEGQIVRFLADPAPEVRGEAARALGDMEADARASQIAALLRDPHPHVRLQAAHALGDLQNPSSRPALEHALGDAEPAVRAKSSWALARVAETESILRRHRKD